MASIIKRKKNYSIVYNYTDENGETRQKWETRTSYQDALKRKAEVENQQFTRTFLPPTDQTIAEFLLDFVSLYGEKRWGVSMYDSQNSLISNYINPIIGDLKVQEVTPRVVDKYIQTLQKTPAVSTKMHKAKTQYTTKLNGNSPFAIRLLLKTKTAANQRKTAYSGCFGTPGETRTHYIPLRRRTLYPGEVRGLIQQIFNFQAQQESNELPLRRRMLYPTELRRHRKR